MSDKICMLDRRTILYEQVMASKFSGSDFLELATEFDTLRFFWGQHFWSQSSPWEDVNPLTVCSLIDNKYELIRSFNITVRYIDDFMALLF